MSWFRVEDPHLFELMTEIKGCFDKVKKLGGFEGFSLNLQKYFFDLSNSSFHKDTVEFRTRV